MISLTEGGELFEPGNPNALAEAIARIMDDPDRADSIARLGSVGIRKHYSAEQMAEQTIAEYERIRG
jgi:glycosyltransferase involved in cell wall biosynthesis